MIEHSAFIEFWTEEAKFVLRVETVAAPPPVGAVINIWQQDYEVVEVSYSIDQPGEPIPEVRYRRNVIIKERS